MYRLFTSDLNPSFCDSVGYSYRPSADLTDRCQRMDILFRKAFVQIDSIEYNSSSWAQRIVSTCLLSLRAAVSLCPGKLLIISTSGMLSQFIIQQMLFSKEHRPLIGNNLFNYEYCNVDYKNNYRFPSIQI